MPRSHTVNLAETLNEITKLLQGVIRCILLAMGHSAECQHQRKHRKRESSHVDKIERHAGDQCVREVQVAWRDRRRSFFSFDHFGLTTASSSQFRLKVSIEDLCRSLLHFRIPQVGIDDIPHTNSLKSA